MKRKESLGTPVVARTVPPHREFQDLRDPSGQHACLDSVGRNSISPIVTEGSCANIKKSERGESVFRAKPPDRGGELLRESILVPLHVFLDPLVEEEQPSGHGGHSQKGGPFGPFPPGGGGYQVEAVIETGFEVLKGEDAGGGGGSDASRRRFPRRGTRA